MSLRSRRARASGRTSVVTAAGLLVLATVSLLGGAGPAGAAPAAPAVPEPDYTSTRTVTREFKQTDGSLTTVDSRDVTVDVDITHDLRARQVIGVSWSGARPSASRATDPHGLPSLQQEYPVVVLQCRGRDDTSLPADQQISPETCWTTFFPQRLTSTGPSSAVWYHDLYATDAERAEQSAQPSWPAACQNLYPILAQHLVPFRAANGTVYPACNAETQAPEMGFDGALPPNEVAGFTALDGTGRMDFEIRTAAENESLGCSTTTACSLVVIPIMGVSCMDANPECRKTGVAAPGSQYSNQVGVDAAVSTQYWWAASNWRNRFVVPLDFALPPSACDVLDNRAPVDFFGSELLNQASLQWAPAYCLRKDRFKLRHNRMSESTAFSAMLGGAAAAYVSSPEDSADVPVGYAPTAVTGFAVAYVVDRPENAGEVTSLRLTPRLLAKLLTQSYPASVLGRGHPGMAGNPLSLNLDPEFIELNPDLSQVAREEMATVLSLSVESDVIEALTSYVAADPEAMAFVHGAADPWGMVVNPSYQDQELPVDEWPLLDDYVPAWGQECQKLNLASSPYFNLVAAPVNSLATIAEAVLDAWPRVQTRCERGTGTDPWKVGRVVAQDYGTRSMLGVVSLGDAERFALNTAELRTSGTGPTGTYVAPTAAAMAAAVSTATQSAPGAAFTVDATALRAVPAAYPGTMIVHTAARLSGLPTTTAAEVADFVSIASNEGQTPGTGIGELPAGYLPITPVGATADLYASAQAVALAIAAQSGPLDGADPTVDDDGPASGGGTSDSGDGFGSSPSGGFVGAGGGAASGSGVPTTTTGDPADQPTDAVVGAASATTQKVVATGPVGHAVPAVLGLGALGLIGAPALRRWSTRSALVKAGR